MSRTVRLNVILLALVVVSFASIVLALAPRQTHHANALAVDATSITDATGTRIPVRRYERIISGSLIADRLLVELVGPERVIAYSPFTPEDSPIAARFGLTPRLDPRGDVERVVSLRPDLMLVNEIVDPGRIGRFRRGGLVVADLGPMRGILTLRRNITMLATLVGERARGEALLARFDRRIRLLSTREVEGRKLRGMYLGIHGSQIYGGASGTSFHDVIVTAGLEDAAAQYDEWPSFSSEQVIALDPDVIVTQTGRTSLVCRHAGFEVLRACLEHRVVELPETLINDPGLSMIEAAEVLHERVYGTGR